MGKTDLMNLADSLTNPVTSVLDTCINGWIKQCEVNKSLKISLAQIENDLQKSLANIQADYGLRSQAIDKFSSVLQTKLDNSSLSFEQKKYFTEFFTKAILDTLNKTQ